MHKYTKCMCYSMDASFVQQYCSIELYAYEVPTHEFRYDICSSTTCLLVKCAATPQPKLLSYEHLFYWFAGNDQLYS